MRQSVGTARKITPLSSPRYEDPVTSATVAEMIEKTGVIYMYQKNSDCDK